MYELPPKGKEFESMGPYGPYFQAKRTEGHRKYSAKLIDAGYAYYCDCPPTEVAGALQHSFRFEHPRNYLGHKVQVEPDARLAEVMGPGSVGVNSFHHQSIKDVAPELMVTALAPDEVIEGVELPGLSFAVGVQWHPEELVNDDLRMLSLFKAFVSAASSGCPTESS